MWANIYDFLGTALESAYSFFNDVLSSLGAEATIVITLVFSMIFAYRFIIQPFSGSSDMVKDLKSKNKGRDK